jgi:hypothetical protein
MKILKIPFNTLLAILLLAPLLLVSSARASVIVGGSTLLNQSYLDTLENWLGQGDFKLTNIYTKAPGDIGVDFHAAADGKGPTFAVMSAQASDGSWKTVGGYNPISWDSSGQPHFTPDPADWNAFIFNLSDSVLRRQSTVGQTTNRAFDGPFFGTIPLGPDLGVGADLSSAYSWGWSYGDAFNAATGTVGSDYQRSIIDGTINAGAFGVPLAMLEVFSVSQIAAIPEPETVTLMLAGLGVLMLRARRSRSGGGNGSRNSNSNGSDSASGSGYCAGTSQPPASAL